MRNLLFIWAVSTLCLFTAEANAQITERKRPESWNAPYDTIRVSEFGAQVNSRQNVTGAVKAALKDAANMNRPLLLFDRGRYDFWPQYSEERVYYESNTSDINPKRLGILVEGMKNLTIDGAGSEFVFHDRMQPLTLDHSQGITVRNRLGHPSDCTGRNPGNRQCFHAAENRQAGIALCD